MIEESVSFKLKFSTLDAIIVSLGIYHAYSFLLMRSLSICLWLSFFDGHLLEISAIRAVLPSPFEAHPRCQSFLKL